MIDVDFNWLKDPAATKNLLLNILATFLIAAAVGLSDPTLSWHSLLRSAAVTAALTAYAKMSKRPVDIAAQELVSAGLSPGRRATDPPAGAPLPPDDPRTGRPRTIAR